MANKSKDSSDDLRLAPPEGKSLTEMRQDMLGGSDEEPHFPDEESCEVRPFQFRLRDIMLVMAVAAFGFAMMQMVPVEVYAGAMGALAIVGLGALALLKPEHAMPHLLWWTLLATYIIASAVAVATKG